jgi:hypothetical protein
MVYLSAENQPEGITPHDHARANECTGLEGMHLFRLLNIEFAVDCNCIAAVNVLVTVQVLLVENLRCHISVDTPPG